MLHVAGSTPLHQTAVLVPVAVWSNQVPLCCHTVMHQKSGQDACTVLRWDCSDRDQVYKIVSTAQSCTWSMRRL